MRYEFFHLGGNNFMPLNWQSFYFLWLFVWRRKLLPKGVGKKSIVFLIRARFALKNTEKRLLLPVRGTWCRRVRGGVKVFDMHRKSTIKVYDQGTDEELMEKEVALLSKIGRQDFAPAIIDHNLSENWYKEDFIEGISGDDLISKKSPERMMERYYATIEPLLEQLIIVGAPKSTSTLDYIKSLVNFDAIEDASQNDKEKHFAIDFLHEMVNRSMDLAGSTTFEINLSFCHGDFHQFNMIWTGSTLKLIDWEAAQRLSFLFDFYNFFFSQIYLGHFSLDWPNEVNKGLDRLKSRLMSSCSELIENLDQLAELYRLVHYVERVSIFLGPFGLDCMRICKWIEGFKTFERALVKK